MKKILFIASAQDWYTRNEFLINFLKNNYDADIIISNKKSYLKRILETSWHFVKVKNKKKYDFVFIGFFAQILIPIVKFFYKGPIIADYFISLYDTLCNDRKTIKSQSIVGKLIHKYEQWTLKKVNSITVDTENSKNYFNKEFKFPLDKITVIYVFANEKLFYPQSKTQSKDFEIFFYGSCQPLHGIDIILKTIKLLEKEDIHFTLVGPIKKYYNDLIKRLNICQNITFIDWLEYKEMPSYIANTDVCLGGHFSDTEKAKRVIAGKTFQFAAMKRAIILGDNPANREIFSDGKDCLMVKMNDEKSLAEAIMNLKNNPSLKDEIASNAYNLMNKIKNDIKIK